MDKGSETSNFHTDERCALELDLCDPLRKYRDYFAYPKDSTGSPLIYLCGNSLGLMPHAAKNAVESELEKWEHLAVEGHFAGDTPWYTYHELLRPHAAQLVGGKTEEVVVMNTLSVNLHLMMVSFYRPTRTKYKILVDSPTFPSDLYAVQSQIRAHGFDPSTSLIFAHPEPGEYYLRLEKITAILQKHRGEIALVLFNGVNFVSGQVFPLREISTVARECGAIIGVDLAHAAGNIPLQLHDDEIDFACWCNYKYLNSGPGAIAGCFVHSKHLTRTDLVRFSGWWGNDPKTRFEMTSTFVPVLSADAWQLSNPPIFSLAPVKASYELFSEVGLKQLREKSKLLTSYLEFLLHSSNIQDVQIITPKRPEERGAQLSLLVDRDATALTSQLSKRGIICDARKPNVLRIAATPFYNSFHEVWRFTAILRELIR